MALGGMRDHIGGGFHRYSVDGDWRVPHFEKMLYDQAQLVLAYVEAAQLTGDPFFADVAADTLAYVRRDLRHPDGGFFSAEDADSVPPEQAAIAVTAQERRRVLHLAGRGNRPGARRRCGSGADALRHTARRQRAIRSAERVHAQEPALYRAIDRRNRIGDRTAGRGRWRRPSRAAGRVLLACVSAGRGRTWTTRC